MPRPLYPGEGATGTHLIGLWVGPRTGVDAVQKGTFLPPPGLELQPVASRYTD
jgi:hypothetical protein